MHSSRFFSVHGFLACGLLLLSGCGNPFAAHDDHAVVPSNAFHTQTRNCNQIDLRDERLDPHQIRAVVSCLNSNHDLEALDRLIGSFSDAELLPLAEAVNATADRHANFFFALKAMYLRVHRDGRLQKIENLIHDVLQDPASNALAAPALSPMAPAIRRLIADPDFRISFESLDHLTASASYRRLMREYNRPQTVRRFAEALSRYLHAPDALSVSALYDLLADHSVAESFQTFSGDRSRVRKLASFLEWVFTNPNYFDFSETLSQIQQHGISCFGGSIAVSDPLKTAMDDLSHMSSDQSRNYFAHDLKNLILVSRGYCEIPYSIDRFVRFLSEATKHPGYDEMFALLQPMMKDDQLVRFLGSAASRTWVGENAFLAQDHFFEDLLTLVTQTQDEPLSNRGRTIAVFLDDSLRNLAPEQIENLDRFLAPLLNAKQNYGHAPIHLITSVAEEFPDLTPALGSSVRAPFARFAETTLQKAALAPTFDLTAKLIQDRQFTPILDQTLSLFERFLDRGKTTLHFGKLAKAATDPTKPIRWLLEKWPMPELAPQNSALQDSIAADCDTLVYDWDFTRFLPQNSSDYFRQFDLIQACVDSNRTFQSAHDLALYLSQTNRYSYVLQTQKALIGEAFRLSPEAAFETLDRFLSLSTDQSETIGKALHSASNVVRSLSAALKKPELRNFLSEQLKSPAVYQALAESLTRESEAPEGAALGWNRPSSIDVQLDRTQILEDEPFVSALQKLFALYCPNQNVNSPTCDIDDDQVALYRKSPETLVAAIRQEYLNSSQSWLDPLSFKGWHSTAETPRQLSDFEYHLNPLLHLVQNRPNTLKSTFVALRRIHAHRYDLERFLRDGALHLTLIPYIYQSPGYPRTTSRQFRDRVRLRLASDLDRLELLAINADFRAFGKIDNLGMNFIREIGLSWGDLPEAERPSTLSRFRSPQNVRTLAETRDYIHSEMARFDKGIFQKLGECDPRGKGRFHRWIQRKTCSDELFDVSARLFNLRFLLPLVDQEWKRMSEPSGGLALLRDLFYSLYEGNPDDSFDYFVNGVDEPDGCLSAPDTKAGSDGQRTTCHQDGLNLIPKITRLGLLHQASVAILNDPQSSAAFSIVDLVERIAQRSNDTDQISDFVSRPEGIDAVRSAVRFGFQWGTQTSSALSGIAVFLDRIPNSEWVSRLIELLKNEPDLLNDHSEPIAALLSGSGDSFRDPGPKTLAWAAEVSAKLPSAFVTELARSLRDLKPQSHDLAAAIRSLKSLPEIESPELKASFADWSERLGSDSGANARARLSNWLKASDYEDFCDVFSDSSFVDKAYNFLEQVHQNPDSRAFFQSCKRFLHTP